MRAQSGICQQRTKSSWHRRSGLGTIYTRTASTLTSTWRFSRFESVKLTFQKKKKKSIVRLYGKSLSMFWTASCYWHIYVTHPKIEINFSLVFIECTKEIVIFPFGFHNVSCFEGFANNQDVQWMTVCFQSWYWLTLRLLCYDNLTYCQTHGFVYQSWG